VALYAAPMNIIHAERCYQEEKRRKGRKGIAEEAGGGHFVGRMERNDFE